MNILINTNKMFSKTERQKEMEPITGGGVATVNHCQSQWCQSLMLVSPLSITVITVNLIFYVWHEKPCYLEVI